MQVEGVKGESSDLNHKGWLDIVTLSWNVNRKITSSTSTANDRESSNAEISDLTFTRYMDSATPKIFINACCGKGKKVVIHMTKTGSGSGVDIFMAYTLQNGLFSGYSVVAAANSTVRPVEIITLSFVDVEVKYTPHDEDGNAQAPEAVGFDTAQNKKR